MNFQSNISAFLEDSLSHHTIPIVETFTVDTLTPIQMIEKLDRRLRIFLKARTIHPLGPDIRLSA